MSKRKRNVAQQIDQIPAKKRKTDEHLHSLIKECITASSSKFIHQYTSNNLSLIIDDYISLDITQKDYPYIYLSTQNKWKHHNKLNKYDKMQYLNEQMIHPLQYLLQQFNLKDIHASPHFEYFMKGQSTSQTKWSNRHKFWISSQVSKSIKASYWKNDDTWIARTINSVCHFIQKESGTGVHIGNGYILSCAHVIASDIDDEEQDINRNKRIKYIIFGNGYVYTAQCIAFNEEYDVSLLKIDFNSLIDISVNDKDETVDIGTAVLADNIPKLKCDLFCIGNPSNINLESNVDEYNDFDPKIFHLSFGKLETENNTNDTLGAYGHSCFTYWGHSGAPVFNTNGYIVGLHNSWNDQTGLRHAVKLELLKTFVNKHCKTT